MFNVFLQNPFNKIIVDQLVLPALFCDVLLV